jgi:hypothetical protein
MSWLLTALLVIDAVFVSAFVLPTFGLVRLFAVNPQMFAMLFLGQGLLWAYCWDHWISDVYWVEFRERGLITFTAFYPWHAISRIGWSPVNPDRLIFLQGGFHRQLAIDPKAKAALAPVLAQLQGS